MVDLIKLAGESPSFSGWQSYSPSSLDVLGFLLGARFVERLETVSCVGGIAWSFSQAPDANELSLIPDAD